jgi:Zn-dependent oligopeptidases
MNLKKLVFILSVCSMTHSYASKPDQNPFLTEFKTQFNAPPFNLIKIGHYEPAFLEGIRQQNAEIKAIIANKAKPTFKNTIVVFDNSGSILRRVGGVFFNLTEAETNDSLTALSIKMAPVLSEHSDNVYLNKALFKRINAIHDQKKSLKLTREQERLLDLIYKKICPFRCRSE